MAKLVIKNLVVSVEGNIILKGLNQEFLLGEIYAVMGPNGHGKSTLLETIMGHPKYKIESGDILFNDKSICQLSVDKRANLGIFLGMQYPQEVPGVYNVEFLKTIHHNKNISVLDFHQELLKASKNLHFSKDLKERFLNQGFSGGEKKKNEILQMKFINPQIAMLDEIDSGLDVDALVVVSQVINEMRSPTFCGIIVSHYDQLYKNINPSKAIIIVNGKVLKRGGKKLIEKVHREGYNWLGVGKKKIIKTTQVTLDSCQSCE